VYTREKYLIDGKNYEILYFAPNNEKFGKDSVAYGGGARVHRQHARGQGLSAWDSIAAAQDSGEEPQVAPAIRSGRKRTGAGGRPVLLCRAF
jgi:hypothetical protein